MNIEIRPGSNHSIGAAFFRLIVLVSIVAAFVYAFNLPAFHQNAQVVAKLVPQHPDIAHQSILEAPTISAFRIDQILKAAHSPAAGTGAVLFADGLHAGIDPIFALAFFEHESKFGTIGVALVTRSLGNIRCSPGYPSCIDGFRSYKTWAASYADWFSLISLVYIKRLGLNTVAGIVPVYAPSRDQNKPQAYIAAIVGDIAKWR